VPGDVELWPNLTGGEAIDLLARLRGGLDQRRRDELCERFDLDPTKKGRTYSKGNRQKVALIAALASDVELLLLDEPTAGLDPLMEAVFQECIREARDAGRTVLLSSHILAQVEVLADRISIIRQGRIVESGTLAELRHLTRTTITAETDRPPTGWPSCPACTTSVTTARSASRSTATRSRRRPRWRRSGVRSLVAHPPTLEQLLLRHYGDEIAEADDAGEEVMATATAPRTSRPPPAPMRPRGHAARRAPRPGAVHAAAGPRQAAGLGRRHRAVRLYVRARHPGGLRDLEDSRASRGCSPTPSAAC
jgi:ABC-2 type transport system ATP-binding protein